MKNLLFVILTLVSCCCLYGQAASNFEIVESTPIGTILDNPDIRNAHEVWLEMINGAKTSLDIEQFYISPQQGEPLDDVLSAIVEAGKRGVVVRLMVDSRMYKTYPKTADSLGTQKNITMRVIEIAKLAGGIQHAKYFLVDHEEAFVGSQNFDWRALKHIHELGARIRNHDVAQFYQHIFDLDWQLAEKNDPALIPATLHHESNHFPAWTLGAEGDTVWMYPTASPKSLLPDTARWDEPNILELIGSARSEVVLQFLSYSTTGRDKSRYDSLDTALRKAASRGVKVKLIASDWEKGSPGDAPLKSLSQVPNIEVRFSVIPEWSGGYISFARVEHCKYICVDGAAFWLGTSNAEKSYFYTTRNLGVIVKNAKLAGTMKKIFYKSWDGPYMEPVKADVDYKPRKHGE
ncbi:MAG TPA: phospholipase D-like domain-containing protein [Bacteroidota bacterium]|nr:phospholipase D-like domain-containing protein [Bacteroidota bacterium]